jgi:hypothetical protein
MGWSRRSAAAKSTPGAGRPRANLFLAALGVSCLVASGVTGVVWSVEQHANPASSAPLPPTTALAIAPTPIAPPASSTTTILEVPVPVRHGVPLTVSIASMRQGDVPIVDAVVGGDELMPPADVHVVGIWTDGAGLAASAGTTLLVGHVNWVGQGDGAFYDLSAVAKGATISTVDAEGIETQWTVTATEVTAKTAGVDPAAFAGPTGVRRLVLVTCGGPYLSAIHSYADNIYIWAAPLVP